MTVGVKFIGSFRSLSGKDKLEIKLERSSPLREVVGIIVGKIPKLAGELVDLSCDGPKTNILVLVNGREISVLDRFNTIIRDGDNIVFVPVVHGG